MDDDTEDDGPPVDPKIAAKLIKGSDFQVLAKLLASLWSAAMVDSYGLVSDHVGETVDPSKDTPARKRLMKLAAEQVTAIDETTRARVAAYVERAVNDGMSPAKLARMIRDDPSGAFSASRAATIARTETAMAYAHGSVAGWRDSGRVERVIIFDGDGCGWGDHDDGDLANGSIRTLDEYESNPIAHPRCVRSAAPYLGD